MAEKLVRLTKGELEKRVGLPTIYKKAIEHAIYEMSMPDDLADAVWPDFFRAEVVNVEAACELCDELKEDEYETEAGWFQAGWKAGEKTGRKAGVNQVAEFITDYIVALLDRITNTKRTKQKA